MNYPSKIKLRDNFGTNPDKIPPMKDRVDRVLKFYRGWFKITSKKKAREWLNGNNHW